MINGEMMNHKIQNGFPGCGRDMPGAVAINALRPPVIALPSASAIASLANNL
jgi:hypothetical protein